MASTARSYIDENVSDAVAAKGAARVPLLSKQARAPFGEIGNIVGNIANRVSGKDGDAKAAAEKSSSTRNMDVLLNNIREKASAATATAWGSTRQRSTQPAVAAKPLARASETSLPGAASTRSRLDGERSMSTLLQKRSAQMEEDLPDIDVADKENPLAVTEYVNSIYSYYYKVEPNTTVGPTYMTNQPDINDKMRAILVDWLVEVHLKFKLMPETLFLTVNLIDRFLAAAPVTRKNLQLVGVTAMLIASKYEEIWAPEVRDFVYISDKAYTREQILAMEKSMLNTLGFHLTVPTPFQFMSRLLKAAGADKQMAAFAQFNLELAMPEYSMLKYKGSMLAAAAIYNSIRALRPVSPQGYWTLALARHSRYTEPELLSCANALARLHRKAGTASLTAVHKKYSNAKFHEVAKMPPAEGMGESETA